MPSSMRSCQPIERKGQTGRARSFDVLLRLISQTAVFCREISQSLWTRGQTVRQAGLRDDPTVKVEQPERPKALANGLVPALVTAEQTAL